MSGHAWEKAGVQRLRSIRAKSRKTRRVFVGTLSFHVETKKPLTDKIQRLTSTVEVQNNARVQFGTQETRVDRLEISRRRVGARGTQRLRGESVARAQRDGREERSTASERAGASASTARTTPSLRLKVIASARSAAD